MRYIKFRIENFKGIKDTTVNLQTIAGASVYAFVGLNESGKTTVLEAIYSFSPDNDTKEILSNDSVGIPVSQRVPRHRIADFNGEVKVTATIEINNGNKESIISAIEEKLKLKVNNQSIPNIMNLKRTNKFENGDHVGSYFDLLEIDVIEVKKSNQKKWRKLIGQERIAVRDLIYYKTPDIAYFPTFVFSFPEKIYLSDRGSKVDKFYKKVFQDILDYDGKGHRIDEHLVKRIRDERFVVPWLAFLPLWRGGDGAAKIQQVIDRASSTVSRVVFGRWDQIFKEKTRGKEVYISYEIDEGEIQDGTGAKQKTNSHDIYVAFEIKDGSRRYKVSDRSLGFRWFFAFMLFTQFRVARQSSIRPVLFLFDEPASNLHAAAQQKLVECFPSIAQGEHALVYTTHSHYMIDPRWLEQTFIVTNRNDNPPESIVDGAVLDDESLDIKVASYRSFVNNRPTQTNYFQPILDRLEVVPSKFDITKNGVVVEGKSDYYILRYGVKLLRIEDIALIPNVGAGVLDAMVALNTGWNLKLKFLLDGDRQGISERNRYNKEFGIAVNSIITLDQLGDKITDIESIFDDEALKKISIHLKLDRRPTKSEIRRFCQERLASDAIISLGDKFSEKMGGILNALKEHLTV